SPPSEMMIGGLAAPSAWALVSTRMFLLAMAWSFISRLVMAEAEARPRGGMKLASRPGASALRRAIGSVKDLHHLPRHIALDAIPDGLPVSAAGDDPVPAQKRQMLRDRGITDAEEFGELADRLLAVDQPAQDHQP